MFIDYPVPSCLIRGSYKFVTNVKSYNHAIT